MKALRFLLFPALFAALLVLGYWVARQPRLEWPKMAAPPQGEACPLIVQLEGAVPPASLAPQAPGLEPPLLHWNVVSTGSAPEVEISHAEVKNAAGDTVPACVLTVTQVPQPPLEGVDWRIGYRLDLPAEMRERIERAVFTADLSPDREAQLGGGSVYLYDGGRPVDDGLADIQPGWRTLRVEMALAPDAAFVELWYRLAFQGGISNPVSLTFAAPTLSLLGAAGAGEDG